MSTEQTKAMMDHHSEALAAEVMDAAALDEIAADYHDDVVFISNLGGVVTGVDAVRAIFASAGNLPGFEQTRQHVDGDVGYVTWKADGIPFATDTFLVRDGKIAVQTVALHFG